MVNISSACIGTCCLWHFSSSLFLSPLPGSCVNTGSQTEPQTPLISHVLSPVFPNPPQVPTALQLPTTWFHSTPGPGFLKLTAIPALKSYRHLPTASMSISLSGALLVVHHSDLKSCSSGHESSPTHPCNWYCCACTRGLALLNARPPSLRPVSLPDCLHQQQRPQPGCCDLSCFTRHRWQRANTVARGWRRFCLFASSGWCFLHLFRVCMWFPWGVKVTWRWRQLWVWRAASDARGS